MKEHEQDNDFARDLIALVEQSEKDLDKHWKSIDKNRKYAAGKIGDEPDTVDGESKLVRANLVYSTIQALMPYIYAKNPEISVTPEDAVEEHRYEWVRPFAKTIEIVLNRQLKDGGLKKQGKRQVRGALISRIGWMKCSYQRNYTKDPFILSRIEDAQDNIARLRALAEEIEENEGDADAKIRELEMLLKGLEEEVDVVSAEGLVLDFVQGNNIITDSAIEDWMDYDKGRFIAQRIFLTQEQARERLECGYEGARLYSPGDDRVGKEPTEISGNGENQKNALICVYEIWHKPSQTVYTIAKGSKQWAREPFQPEKVGQRWYPFFGLAFYPLDGERDPISLVEMLRELVDEYNATRTQLAEHRAMSIPHWIADKQTDIDDIERKRDAQLGEIVIVDSQGRPLNQVFTDAAPPPFNPAIYDTSPIRTDIELISGLQDAARGSVMKAKTATEAEFMQQGMMSRTEDMKDTVEDVYAELARYATEILLQELTPMQVLRIAGPGGLWPDLPKEEIYDMVEIGVRAGSTGKPNRRMEQETWIKVKPEIENSLMQIFQMQSMGQDPGPIVNLLKETLRRFDERIDVEQFLPNVGQPQMPGGGNVVQFPGQGQAPAQGVAPQEIPNG